MAAETLVSFDYLTQLMAREHFIERRNSSSGTVSCIGDYYSEITS
jgi:hypothetical protein